MITKFYLVRHTQTIGNVEHRLTGREDYKITKEGQDYIDDLTQKLEKVYFYKAYSSTSDRAKKTILPLAQMKKIDIVQDENLCEMYFGKYDGWKWEEVNKINPQIDENHVKTNEIIGIENQETTEQVADRMYNYMESIAKENAGRIVLVGSHGVAIEAFLRKITKEPFVEKREEYSQKNTSVNIVAYDTVENKFNVLVLNDYTHLEQ